MVEAQLALLFSLMVVTSFHHRNADEAITSFTTSLAARLRPLKLITGIPFLEAVIFAFD